MSDQLRLLRTIMKDETLHYELLAQKEEGQRSIWNFSSLTAGTAPEIDNLYRCSMHGFSRMVLYSLNDIEYRQLILLSHFDKDFHRD